MLKNYFKTAWRSIRRYKLYSTLNILGLALGIASCIVIFLVVKYELGYDRFNKKADRIYRVTLNVIDFNPSVSMAVAPALRASFPEIEQVCQVWYQQDGMITIGQTRYTEKGYAYADEQFPKIFDYEWLSGNPRTALAEPNTVVLTNSIAQKYFGDKDAMGQVINLDNRHDLKVTGVIKDVPGNSSIPFNFLVSFETVKADVKGMMNEFYAIAGGTTYIMTPPGYDINRLQQQMPSFIASHWNVDIGQGKGLVLQPLTAIHFDQRYLNSDASPTTSKQTYWALSAIALFIMIIACINFINLATAQAIRRAREIGVRKVLGSNRSQLIAQFLGETTLMVSMALVLAVLAVIVLLPQLATWLDIKINIDQLLQPTTLFTILGVVISMIVLAGLYPAFIQSAFNPIQSLKDKPTLQPGKLTLRKSLVVVQFAISQIMIVGTLVVAYQMDFFKNRDLGFNKDAVVSIGIPERAKRNVLLKELSSMPGVQAVSLSSGAPAYSHSFSDFNSDELMAPKNEVTELKFIDEKYTDLFKLKMLAGQPVMRKDSTDTTRTAVVNETLMQKLNVNNPLDIVGKHMMLAGRYTTIVGVVQDFQSESKHKKRRPVALLYNPRGFYNACVKLQPAAMPQTIARIDKAWSALFPQQLFEYEFLDDHIAKWYRQEEKQYTAFKIFAGIAILIGCIGLYGLVAFAAAQRTKEVGIRKVLGASLGSIVYLFSREFALLIVIAFLIAAPLGYYIMHNWLQNFAYQVNMNAGIFFTAIAVSILIAGITIGWQAIRAGMVSPVKSLRSE